MGEKKKFYQMTDREVTEFKRKQCARCIYFSRDGSGSLGSATCEYSKFYNCLRPCSPLDCKTKGIFKPRGSRKKRNKMLR